MLQYSNSPINTSATNATNSPSSTQKSIPGSQDIVTLLKRQPISSEKKINIFFRQDAYELYGGESTCIVGEIMHLSNQIRQSHNEMPFLSLSLSSFISSTKELLNRRFVICLWKFSSSRNAFAPFITATPGNHEALEEFFVDCLSIIDGGGDSTSSSSTTGRLSETQLPSLSSHNELCFIDIRIAKEKGLLLTLSFYSPSIYQLGYSTFNDSPTFSNLESVLCQLGVKECVASVNLLKTYPNITVVFERVGVLLSTTATTITTTSSSSSSSSIEEITKLIEPSSSISVDILDKHSISSLHSLIEYLGLLEKDVNLKKFTIKPFQMQEYVRLDDTAIRGLNILPNAEDPSFSLLHLLNHCQTGTGIILLKEWLRQPLRSKATIEIRQHLLNVILENNLSLAPLLRGLPDIPGIFKKLIRASTKGSSGGGTVIVRSLEDLYHLYLSLSKVEPLFEEFSPFKDDPVVTENILRPLKDLSSKLARFAETIEEILDFSAIARHEYLIVSEYNPVLKVHRDKKIELLDEIEEEFINVSLKLSLERGKKIKLEHSSLNGYHFRTTVKGIALPPKDYEELGLLKSGLLFRSWRLKELSSLYEEESALLLEMQKENVAELVNVTLGYRNLFYDLSQLISTLDVLQSFSRAITQHPSPMVRPTILSCDAGERVLEIVDGRHPLLEISNVQGGGGEMVVVQENSCSFSSDQKTFYSITGPNMGGKTTFIRQTALLVLLAQIGMWVPCLKMKLSTIDAILIRVGSGDSLCRGLSTFMVEMLEIGAILAISTERSLVLIDELGRGTGSSDGFGLAWAISKALIRGGPGLGWGNSSDFICGGGGGDDGSIGDANDADVRNRMTTTTNGPFTLFATHFHRIAELEKEFEKVGNLKADVDLSTETLTFRIVPGHSDISWGLHVAKKAQFPPKMIEMAEMYMNE